ncbi:MAG TPA: DinB family protein [Candidatus Limnocylindrales bacterium]|jgi:hypothetical protein
MSADVGADYDQRLAELETRLGQATYRAAPSGLTEPDPDTPDERWEAAQVWAHMAEFIGYWQRQIADVVGAYSGEPVAFGRTKRDEARIAAIEQGRRQPLRELEARALLDLAELRRYLRGLRDADWQAVGRHPTLGEMTLPRIVERFLTGHLAEHLDQLDGLAAAEAAGRG